MSKSTVSKASAILVGLSMLAITISPAIALDSTTSAVRPAIKKEATSSVAPRKQAVQQKVETKKEKIASKTAELKTKLQAFKDKRKAETADRVNTNLNKINQNQTAQMLKHLDKMSAILDKLEAMINGEAPAIASARETISTASAAVSAQTLKDYTVTISSEARVRLDAKLQKDKLHTDLLSLRKIVIDAKQSVGNAIRIVKSGSAPVGKEVKEGTISGQQ